MMTDGYTAYVVPKFMLRRERPSVDASRGRRALTQHKIRRFLDLQPLFEGLPCPRNQPMLRVQQMIIARRHLSLNEIDIYGTVTIPGRHPRP
jgi:hypothetical protein